VKLIIPAVFSIDEKTARKNPIHQLSGTARQVEGALANYTRGALTGSLFQSTDGSEQILIVPPKSKSLPDNQPYIIEANVVVQEETVDLSEGIWLRRPIQTIVANQEEYLQEILASWRGAFSYTQEDLALDVKGLRAPQIGALHAIHAHWAVSNEPATIVMPTGTGKTETMLSILLSASCPKLLVIVPTDALRTQIADKFITLGILKLPNVSVLLPSAKFPIVCKLEHIPLDIDELDNIMSRTQVVVTASSIIGQCSNDIQERFAHHCPYLFIDEAHHAEAPTWSAFNDKFQGKSVVQFTATPFREDGKPLDGKIVFKYPLRKAQEEGYFKPIHFERVVEFDLRLADKKIADKAVQRLREELGKGHILMARVDSVARAREVFEHYKMHTDLKPVQLHTGIKSKRDRELARKQLISKESRIVVCVDMLGEGFDLPELKIAAFHDIRKSLAVTLQLAGRFTRSRTDLGDATFIANVADVNVQEELQRLYTRDPDWNLLLPDLSEQMIGQQSSLQDFISNFSDFPAEIPLKAVKPATSTVVNATRCDNWHPEAFKSGIPSAEGCERFHHSLNQQQNTLVVVTARRVGLQWTDAENLFDWQWELYVIFWDSEKSLLFINSSSNSGDFNDLAQAITGDKATLISGQRVFRVFSGINRLRLQNVGLSEQIGRNVRYTGRMGSDVESRLTEAMRGNAQKSVIAGAGFEKGALSTMGASRKGRIWSHQRDHLDQFVAWCRSVGGKLLDQSIDPDQVLSGTLIPEIISTRPNIMPLSIDWPESVYTEPEKNWVITIRGKDYLISSLSINLVTPNTNSTIRFEVAADDDRVEFDLEIFGEGDEANYRFLRRGDDAATIKHGQRAHARSLEAFFDYDPPVIWFVDGSALEGNQYVPLRTPQPPYDSEKIAMWDWSEVDITSESQGEQRKYDTVQAQVIRKLSEDQNYTIIFDDDGAGEAADVVAIRVIGGVLAPERIEVEFYHCKYSHGPMPGHRIIDLYEVCGQAQKSIWWAASPQKKSDLLTHLMRRESLRKNNERPTRFERGTVDLLHTIREISKLIPVSFAIAVVQPGISKRQVSIDQLQLLGVTNNHLWETYQLPFSVIGSA
jgi:superfamily II DNA or RNA helicase